MTVITISRQFGAGGEMLAEHVANELGYRLVDRKAIIDALQEMGLPPHLIQFDEQVAKGEDAEKRRRFYLTALHEYLIELAKKESFILVGRGGQFLFRNHPDAFHIFVHAPFKQRVQWIREINDLTRKPASKLVREHDRRKKRFLRQVFDHPWLDMDLYDLTLNTGTLMPEGAAILAVQAVKAFQDRKMVTTRSKQQSDNEGNTHSDIRFMHPSEEEFARFLDFYNISWEYEPRTFPLQWDSEGNVTEAFSPDFFLPDQNLYVELTTQRQKLVWKKNKKARRLQELYPGVKVKIIYNKDLHHILDSFGLDKPQ
ncbi:cytidylate kinase family protein [Dethiobacter alkaliphilus]|uniref:cytidylate kinase family protein n=1 Tax=Dethiobacter alkaliphilus TaxID=427926 RepID=UPI002227E491|nr:cytidylate kinase family protein [Dethiobacter alkaliphilus]MCW3489014.1 cytidylate kinase family protein [Dethiobacter alkaliphilus]